MTISPHKESNNNNALVRLAPAAAALFSPPSNSSDLTRIAKRIQFPADSSRSAPSNSLHERIQRPADSALLSRIHNGYDAQAFAHVFTFLSLPEASNFLDTLRASKIEKTSPNFLNGVEAWLLAMLCPHNDPYFQDILRSQRDVSKVSPIFYEALIEGRDLEGTKPEQKAINEVRAHLLKDLPTGRVPQVFLEAASKGDTLLVKELLTLFPGGILSSDKILSVHNPSLYAYIPNSIMQAIRNTLSNNIDPFKLDHWSEYAQTSSPKLILFFALLEAAGNGHLEIVKCLLKAIKIHDSVRNVNIDGALLCAAYFGRIDVIHFLLDSSLCQNENTQQGAFSLAAKKGHLNVLDAFIEKGFKIKNTEVDRICLISEQSRDVKVIEYLHKKFHCPEFDSHPDYFFVKAACEGDMEKIRNPKMVTSQGRDLVLECAVQKKHSEIVDIFLRENNDPLHFALAYASSIKEQRVVDYLLQYLRSETKNERNRDEISKKDLLKKIHERKLFAKNSLEKYQLTRLLQNLESIQYPVRTQRARAFFDHLADIKSGRIEQGKNRLPVYQKSP